MSETVRRFRPMARIWKLLGLDDLTFLKKRPRFNYPKEWPPDPDMNYEQELHWQGFISREFTPDVEKYPIIEQDLRDLEEYLLPIFWDFNQKAKYYQNNFYLYQWVFIFGAFFTTFLAVMTTYYGSFGNGNAWVLFFGPFSGNSLVTVFSILTALVSFVTSYYTLLSNYGEPRKRWANYRRRTEELRMIYFKFISRIEPFNTASRVDELRRVVLDIRRQEEANA